MKDVVGLLLVSSLQPSLMISGHEASFPGPWPKWGQGGKVLLELQI